MRLMKDLEVLAALENLRLMHENGKESADLVLRFATAVVAEAMGFGGRADWTRVLKNECLVNYDGFGEDKVEIARRHYEELVIPCQKTLAVLRKYDLCGHDDRFYYMFLDRLKSDCLYYLGNGGRYAPHLWTHDEREQIELMRAVYALLPEKPEWLTAEQIENFAKEMGVE